MFYLYLKLKLKNKGNFGMKSPIQKCDINRYMV